LAEFCPGLSANEDATGVHEVLWSANGWWPDKPASERLRLAEDALWWALDRGLITLHYDQAGDARSLAPHEYQERLRDWRTWAIPDGPALYVWRGVKEGTGDIDHPDLI
jgi:hypothetical protein